MVALNFNAHAFAFQSGLDTIEQGYEAAVNGITLEINRKKAAFYDYCRYIENGGAPTEERDDDGVLIWSKDQYIGRSQVCTPVTNANIVCRLLLENKNLNRRLLI